MKTLSLKLEESIFEVTNRIAQEINISRNKYIIDALVYYNKIQRRKLIEKKLKSESTLVSIESIKILNEFESVEYVD